MGKHPLIDRAAEKDVRQAKGFRDAAAALTGEMLAADYEKGRNEAPRRADAGKKLLVAPNKRLASERRPGRDSDHAAIALVARRDAGGAPLLLPDDEGTFEPLHAGVVLKSAPADKERGADDPNYGIDKVDLLGIGPDDRLTCVTMRFLAPGATRVGTGDTPLRALLEGLAHAAVADANRDALLGELAGRTERAIQDAPPIVAILGSQRYWELCRKREAQKGAAWIRELERLAAELEEASGISVRYWALRVQGDPGWSYESGGPVFEGEPRILPAWEHGAGRVRPKAKPRTRRAAPQPADALVEPDLSRPVRSYALSDHYSAGDRIEHPKLGLGVVQGLAGPGKIHVLFDESKRVLVHDRASRS